MEATLNLDKYTENPTSFSLNNNLWLPIDHMFEKKVDFFIKPMDFVREEDYIQLGQETSTLNSFSVARIREFLPLQDDCYASLYLRLDNHLLTVERTTIDVFSQLGIIGGVRSIIVLVLGGLTTLFTDKKFVASIIRKLYHIRGYPELSKIRKRNTCGDRTSLVDDQLEAKNMWNDVE